MLVVIIDLPEGVWVTWEVRDLPGQAHDHPTGEFRSTEAVSVRGAKDPTEERSVGSGKPSILGFQPRAPTLASLILCGPKNQTTWAARREAPPVTGRWVGGWVSSVLFHFRAHPPPGPSAPSWGDP